MERLAIVGDVHGDAAQLDCLLRHEQVAARTIVLTGDIIGRGPSSSLTVTLLCRALDEGRAIIPLLGNHEYALMRYLRGGDFVEFALSGGLPTLRSYIGVASHDVRMQLRSAIPERHLRFLAGLQYYFETDEVLVTHTGISLSDPQSRDPSDIVLGSNSGLFQQPIPLDKMVVCGHYRQRSGTPFVSADRKFVCIDTGCGMAGGILTALLLPEFTFLQVPRNGAGPNA